MFEIWTYCIGGHTTAYNKGLTADSADQEQRPTSDVEGTALRALRRDCPGGGVCGRLQKKFCCIESSLRS